MPNNLDFRSSGLASKEYDHLPKAIVSDSYKSIAQAFQSNMKRVRVLGDLPAELNYWSMIASSFRIKARYILGTEDDSSETDEERELSNRLLNEWKMLRDLCASAPLIEEVLETGNHNFSALIDADTSGELYIAAEAILSAMITESWAAFEAMAIDLWVAALNRHPKPLAVSFAEKNGEKNLTLSFLASFNFDVSADMGTILRQSRKVGFETLEDLKRAYIHAFGDGIRAVFDSHPKLFLSEKTRHLLAHRSGVIDEQFVSAVSGSGIFLDPQINKRLVLTGPLVADLVSQCVLCGVALLKFVDAWSLSHDKNL